MIKTKTKVALAIATVLTAGAAQAATTHTMTDGRFDFKDAGGAVAPDATYDAVNDIWSGTGHNDVQGAFDMVNGGGSFDTTTPFNGVAWHADVSEMDMHATMQGLPDGGAEAHTFEWTNRNFANATFTVFGNCRTTLTLTDGCADLYADPTMNELGTGTVNSYNYNLTNGQFAAGVFFDWSTNNDIPVLAIMQVTAFNPDGSMNVASVDLAGNVSGFGSGNCGVSDLCGVAMSTDPFPGQTPIFSGVIAPVPVPAAVWLFGSGLLGLVGVARRRKA